MEAPLDAFFRAAPAGGQRLYLHQTPPPGVSLRGVVLYVHPWAEEMNKSRRMAALASAALAAQGWAVLRIDLAGCGDSSGGFEDASWACWVDDVADAAAWLRNRHPGAPLVLWGLRIGAMLASAAAPRVSGLQSLLFWQPVHQGRVLLQQFLRLKAAAHLAGGDARAVMDAAREDLAAGRAVEIAGYTLAGGLAAALQDAVLLPPPVEQAGRLVWLEVSGQASPSLSPAARAALPAWQSAGWAVDAHVVEGPAFWQTSEIEEADALVRATVAALTEGEVDDGDAGRGIGNNAAGAPV